MGRSGPILVIAPGRRCQGGITSVVALHERTTTWRTYNCHWIETHDNTALVSRIRRFLGAAVVFARWIWFARAVHVHMSFQTSALRKLPFVATARMLGKPIILHIHAATVEPLNDKTWVAGFTRRMLRAADCVVALSESWARALGPYSRCVVVVPNPVEDRPEAPSVGHDPGTVLFVGRLGPRKGSAELIRAMTIVLRAFPGARLILAGDGDTAAATRLVDSLALRNAVQITGWVDRPTLEHMYSKAALVCLPSHGEGVPMSILEAMARGIPVITTAVGGLPEIIDGTNGLIVPPGMPGEIAAAIIRLLADPKLRRQMGRSGRETVRARFSLPVIDERLLGLYRMLELDVPMESSI